MFELFVWWQRKKVFRKRESERLCPTWEPFFERSERDEPGPKKRKFFGSRDP